MSTGPVVDAHFHLWDLARFHYPWLADPGAEGLQWDYLVDDWQRDTKDVELLATVHVQAEIDHAADPAEETAWLASLAAEQDAERAVPTVCVGYADLRAPDLDEVLDRHQQHALFRGVRQEAWYDPESTRADVPRTNLLDDPAWVAGLDRLAARGLSFDLLVWWHQLEQAAAIFGDRPDLPVVLEHTGVPADASPEARELWRRGMRAFAAQVPHAILKISGLIFVSSTWALDEVAPVVREAMDAFGPERCMFASNFPVDKLAIGYTELWDAYDRFTADCSAQERAAMFRENALRVYRIDAAAAG